MSWFSFVLGFGLGLAASFFLLGYLCYALSRLADVRL